MAEMRIAASTGKIDRRCLNGNNNTKRGKDKKPRRRKFVTVLKDEVAAGLKARLDIVLEYYGGAYRLAKIIGVTPQSVESWVKRGRISPDGARRIQNDYRRNGCSGFRASYCRPDLKFDGNGKPLERKCSDPKMLQRKR